MIRYGVPGQELPMTPELKQLDTTARTWLSCAQFPRELGNSLVNAITKVAQHTKAMTPDQLVSCGEGEYVKLQQAYGQELEEKLIQAGEMVVAL